MADSQALTDLKAVAADLQTSLDAKQQAIADKIAADNQTIADLQAQIGQGGTSDADLQPIIDSLKASKDDLESTVTA